jgi:hypothetical protein
MHSEVVLLAQGDLRTFLLPRLTRSVLQHSWVRQVKTRMQNVFLTSRVLVARRPVQWTSIQLLPLDQQLRLNGLILVFIVFFLLTVVAVFVWVRRR